MVRTTQGANVDPSPIQERDWDFQYEEDQEDDLLADITSQIPYVSPPNRVSQLDNEIIASLRVEMSQLEESIRQGQQINPLPPTPVATPTPYSELAFIEQPIRLVVVGVIRTSSVAPRAEKAITLV